MAFKLVIYTVVGLKTSFLRITLVEGHKSKAFNYNVTIGTPHHIQTGA